MPPPRPDNPNQTLNPQKTHDTITQPHPQQQQGNAGVLRDRAIECVGVVGAAVGRARFAPDAVAVMDLLVGQLQVRGDWVGLIRERVCVCTPPCRA